MKNATRDETNIALFIFLKARCSMVRSLPGLAEGNAATEVLMQTSSFWGTIDHDRPAVSTQAAEALNIEHNRTDERKALRQDEGEAYQSEDELILGTEIVA
jgi:hypothetical protein